MRRHKSSQSLRIFKIYNADFVAAKIIKAIQDDKEEIVIGGFKENLGIWMKRFFPSVFSVMVRKMAVR